MLHHSFRRLLQPFATRVSSLGGHIPRPVPNCFVRYRKTLYTPLSPTKLFRVKERHVEDPDERAELYVLYARYRTTIKALRYTHHHHHLFVFDVCFESLL